MANRLFKQILWVVLLLALALSGCTPGVLFAFSPLPTVYKTSVPTLENDDPTTPPTDTTTPVPTPTITPNPTPTPTVTPTVYAYGPDNFPPEIDPLTGLPVKDTTRLDRRPIIIKIPNYPRNVRPQSGISLADIVYEYYLERGITRFIAIFYGNDAEKAGPIRSARFFDEHIFRMYQGFFVFGNADHRVMDYFLTLGKDIVNRFVLESPEDTKHSCSPEVDYPLCRDRSIVSYNNMFANTRVLSDSLTSKNIDNSRQPLEGMTFEANPPKGGEPGQEIDLDYSVFIYSRWLYDINSGRYLRFADTHEDNLGRGKDYAPLSDQLTGQPIAADNVAILFVPHEYFVNTPTTEIVKINLIGVGNAILFRDGLAYPAYWYRPEDDRVLYLLSVKGGVLPFKPGITFFEVMGTTSNQQQDGGAWNFEFAIP